MRTARDGSDALRDALTAEGGTVADVLDPPPPDRKTDHAHPGPAHPGPAQLAATGPRTRGREREYELLLEMILEGYRLHYTEPLVVRPEDPDLALLLGDQLYALGLARLAALGDVEAVAELADVISLAAQAHSAADPGLAEAVWEAGAVAVGWWPTDDHRQAKERARASQANAAEALLRAAASARNHAAL